MATKRGTERPKREPPVPTIEQQYLELMRRMWMPAVPLRADYGDSLEQPSPLRVVRNVVTYSAYEDPV